MKPEQYLEYVALKGDPSDNIPGVPGVGEKTAAKLVQEYGSVEEIVAHVDELRGKLKENVKASIDQLSLNRELARIVTDLPLDVEPEDCVLGEWDPDEVRRLFTSLEFRSLLDRLQEAGISKPKVEVTELDLREVPVAELVGVLEASGPKAVQLDATAGEIRGAAASAGGAQAAYAPLTSLEPLADRARIADRAEVDARCQVPGAWGDRWWRGDRRRGVRLAAGGVPAGSRGRRLPAPRPLREVPGGRRPGTARGRGRGAVVQRGRLASGRRRGRGRRAAGSGDGRAGRQAGSPRAARDGGAAARVGARPHGGAWRRARRGLPGGDGDVGPRADGRAAGGRVPRRRRGVQPELAAAAPRDPVREARTVARQAHAEGPALHGRERAGEAPRSSGGRRAARLARAGQAQLDVPGGAAPAGRPARRAHPHLVQPGGCGDRAVVVVQPEPAEHPGANRARTPDPSGVRPGLRRSGVAGGRLLADRAADPGAPVGRRGVA